MTPEEYLERAERYRKALPTAKDAFTRHHLEMMERSYRTLADSERQLRKSGLFVNDAAAFQRSLPDDALTVVARGAEGRHGGYVIEMCSSTTQAFRNDHRYRRLGEEMTEKRIVLFPGMIKPLRLRVRGFLIQRGDGLCDPGGNQPICTMSLARKMIEGGWLEQHGQRYEPTEQGLQAAE